MTRSSRNAANCLTVCLAAALFGQPAWVSAEPNSGNSLPVRGEMVDADTPVTYRLPVVGIFDAPRERVAMRSDLVKAQQTDLGHPERSEGSVSSTVEILRCAQNYIAVTPTALVYPP